jgi:hypothetical protein
VSAGNKQRHTFCPGPKRLNESKQIFPGSIKWNKIFDATYAANGIEILNTKAFQLLPNALPGTPKKVLLLKTLHK